MKVLVVGEGEGGETRARISAYVAEAGGTVRSARDGTEALALLRRERMDLVVLDLTRTDGDVAALGNVLRMECAALVIAVGPGDNCDPGTLGDWVDGYLAAPFSRDDLAACIATLARERSRLTAGALVVDAVRREAWCGGERLALRNKEFDLLVMFLRNPGVPLRREQLLKNVWGYDVPGQTRTVDVHVNHLRRRLTGTGVVIRTVRGAGYLLVDLRPET